MTPTTPQEIRTFFINTFGMEDLPTVAAFLGVNHEDLAGQAKSAKFLELTLWLQRRGLLPMATMLSSMLELFDQRFNISEIKTIAFDLQIDLDNVAGGQGKSSFVMKLFYAVKRQNKWQELLNWIRFNRPDILNTFVALNPGR